MGLHPHKCWGPWISVRTEGGRRGPALPLKSWRSSLWHRCRPPVAAPTLMPTCRGLVLMFTLCSISLCYRQAHFNFNFAYCMHKRYICFDLVVSYIWTMYISVCCILYFSMYLTILLTDTKKKRFLCYTKCIRPVIQIVVVYTFLFSRFMIKGVLFCTIIRQHPR